ncbi:hypothetical protein ASF60_18625 [Methylobacterium sp. Leaf113]|uniref:hypothetical protein n=1 Tax=Methylobacterium sp. Leaf113 TaxID=1736259 RepID=UPI0006F76885|nr:hypothetical protein [Methylobacterium sp. Leaf113]KQP91260.1 hypothetical protein ASF60_18625 [Methylobacterium sp. Leaf113]
MKRRSARPFTVEIKHNRASLSEASARPRKDQNLWHDVSLEDADTRVEAPAAPAAWGEASASKSGTSKSGTSKSGSSKLASSKLESSTPEAPARRILPSLLPMFVPSPEPEVQAAPVVERLPRVRRVKPPAPRQAKPKSGLKDTSDFDASPRAALQVQQEATVPPAAAAPPVARPASMASPTDAPAASLRATRRVQKDVALRPGERWKRRLPRALW